MGFKHLTGVLGPASIPPLPRVGRKHGWDNGTHLHGTVFALSEAFKACLVAERPFLL